MLSIEGASFSQNVPRAKKPLTEEQKAKRLAYQRQYRAEHRDQANASNRAYYLRNRESYAQLRKASRERQIERIGIDAMRDIYKKWNEAKAKRRKLKGPTAPLGSEMTRLLRQDQLYAAAVAVVPAAIPRDVRDDIVSIICLAVLEGEIWIEDIPRYAKEFINRHYRQFSKFTTISLDAPIWHDSEKTLLDTLTTENAVLL